MQYCVQQVYTVNCAHIWTELTVRWIGFCLTGPISLCLDSFFVCITLCTLHACVLCSIVTWWGGPGGIDAYPQDYYFLQCFDTVGWVIWPVKTVPDMTYNVFSGTLNPAQSVITYHVRRSRGKMYTGHTSVCLCVPCCMLSLLHGPGCNVGDW